MSLSLRCAPREVSSGSSACLPPLITTSHPYILCIEHISDGCVPSPTGWSVVRRPPRNHNVTTDSNTPRTRMFIFYSYTASLTACTGIGFHVADSQHLNVYHVTLSALRLHRVRVSHVDAPITNLHAGLGFSCVSERSVTRVDFETRISIF